jgi:hypothetical protein
MCMGQAIRQHPTASTMGRWWWDLHRVEVNVASAMLAKVMMRLLGWDGMG